MIDPTTQKQIEDIIDNRIKTQFLNMSKIQPTPFHQHNGVDTIKLNTRIALSDFNTNIAYQVLALSTAGTTAVNVFDPLGSPYDFTITSVISIAQDTTAGNITLSNQGNTVCTIAKGTVASVPVGASSLANTSVAKANSFTVVSSSAGNSFIIIYFTLI